ncbi:MAG: hypothetical protein BROFUL_00373 [Candidatus Brocadia fulgida]|jgi:hypothetical protein|uniref:Uncharacterized protein n=1 Tax=Candidatus Brocadia fulgida TaxID=380242 RepID=A0A0M2UXT5_9BACT|nr:MAG: hypothetical protein BROFUL_00373 [Candidatus Brocadia fulgida]MBV6517965.1 hypothetical protein [Candidatus Brocadia fulgida]
MFTIPCRGRFETCPYKTIVFIERIFQKAKLLPILFILVRKL